MENVPQATSRTSIPGACRRRMPSRKGAAKRTRSGLRYKSSYRAANAAYHPEWASDGLSAENRTRNDEPLDFRGALIDLRDPLVAVQFLDDVIFDKTIPAVDLDGGVDGPVRGLRGEKLRHARFVRVSTAELLRLCRPIRQQARGVDFRRHVRKLPLDCLEFGDSLAERLPLLRILRGLVQGPLRDAEGLRRDADPTAVEGGHRDVEALVQIPQQVLLRDPHVIEAEEDRVARADSHLVLLLEDGEALRLRRDDEGGDLVFRLPGPCVPDDDLCDGPVRRERLRPVQDPLVPFKLGRGPHRGGIRPASRLREGVGPDPLPSGDRTEIRSLLVLR